MWNEMSYNRLNFTFSERLETEPDYDENVFLYYGSQKLIINHFITKVTKKDGLNWG